MRFCFINLNIYKSIINIEKEQQNYLFIKLAIMLQLYGNGVINKLQTKSQVSKKFIPIYYS